MKEIIINIGYIALFLLCIIWFVLCIFSSAITIFKQIENKKIEKLENNIPIYITEDEVIFYRGKEKQYYKMTIESYNSYFKKNVGKE